MRLVSHFEVAYFRSVYKDQIEDCGPMNVVFGRNDSGKSNLLRALNLFFNNQTNPGQSFRFDRDFNHSRMAEASQGSIKKFVYVKLWFQTPPNWRASLGESFWVKKQWSATNQGAQITTDIADAQQQFLTRFLNKIRFYYIPAIKDRRIFEELQSQIYERIAADAGFAQSLAGFTTALRDRTAQLSQGLLDGLNITSVVSTPKDLTDLFRSLDFETTSEAGDSYSLTLQRGDGIQVRHIPLILSFLSERNAGNYYLWGFEEPENSLEMANAIKEAEAFQAFGAEPNIQIFLTSHSPAFFSLEGNNVRRFFVSRSVGREGRLNSAITPLLASGTDLPGDLMGETPHLAVISSYLREADTKIRALAEASTELQAQLQRQQRSILFVEGEADKIILDGAWEILFPQNLCPFDIQPAGGTTKMEALAAKGKVLSSVAPGRRILVLVDNDAEGRKVYPNRRLDVGGFWTADNSSGVWWCRLPVRADLRELMGAIQAPETELPGCMENLFSTQLREDAVIAGELQLTNMPHAEFVSPQRIEAIVPYMTPRQDLAHHFVLSPHPDFKIRFAEWLVNAARQQPRLFDVLRPVLERAANIVTAP